MPIVFADGDQDYLEKLNDIAAAYEGAADIVDTVDDHIAGTADKHAASAIVNTPAGGIAATDVQAAINELDTEKQPLDATLTAFAALTIAADKLPYGNGSDTFATTDLTSAGRALLDDADADAQRTTLGLGTAATLASDTNTSLAANSDTRLATQKAVKAYVDALIAASDAVVFKGVTDCSANPNYPAADAGHLYIVSVAGKIGGASGVVVEAGDMFICKVDSTASGNQATVGANWGVIQTNINGALTTADLGVTVAALAGSAFTGVSSVTVNSSSAALTLTNTGSGAALDVEGFVSAYRGLWPTSSSDGANWASRDAQLFVMSDIGHIAIAGAAKTSILDSSLYAPIGISGFLLNDAAERGWASYFDVQHESGAVWSAGCEIALKNKVASTTRTPYAAFDGVFGHWLLPGGDPAYGGAATHPVTAGMVFVNPITAGMGFNAGIVYDQNSLVLSSGIGNAMHMAVGHSLTWANANTANAARIYSSATTAVDYRLLFTDTGMRLTGAAAAPILSAVHASNGINYLTVTNGATGVNPVLSVTAGDTNRGFNMTSQGTGSINVYTNSLASRAVEFGHVATAVNYPQIQGGATGVPVQITALGSDSSVGFAISSKGGGSHRFFTGGAFANEAFRIVHAASSVNYGTVTASATGAPILLGVAGTDTNIDLSLVPKGSGNVRMGTHSAIAAETVTGYITIKDSGGTTRKLAVVS